MMESQAATTDPGAGTAGAARRGDRGRTDGRGVPGAVVVKVGGSVLADEVPGAVVAALAELRDAGVPVVLVHGGGRRVTDVLDRLGVETRFVDGLRVTSPEVMEVVEMVLAGRVNTSLTAALQEGGVPAMGLSGVDGDTVRAGPHDDAERLGLVGTVEAVDTDLVRRILDGGYVPVLCSVAGSDEGSLNVNADEIASSMAAALGAEHLVLLTDVPGVFRSADGRGEPIAELTVPRAREMLDDGAAAGGMRPKVRACLAALEAGVGAAHVLGVEDVARLPAVIRDGESVGTVFRREGDGDEPGARSRSVGERADRVLLGTYKQLPFAFRRGRGSLLRDVDGREYLDFIAGIAVSSLGHGHPALVDAVAGQASRYLHVSNLYLVPEQVAAAERLADASGLGRVFFCNSGAEAVEGVLKVARKWGRAHRGEGCHRIVVMERAFHGRTLGALSATWNPRYREPFEPLTPGFDRVPFNDLEAVDDALGPETCAVLVEPLQGEGGVIPADEAFLRGLRALTRERDVLLALDEVQTGIGRTGTLFAYEQYDIVPDLVALAKGLGGGVPIGAVLASDDAASVMEPGDHASTFGGNALSTSAALAVLEHLLDEGGIERAAAAGRRLRERLEELVSADIGATGVRGRGLLLALDVAGDPRSLMGELAHEGLLVGVAGDGALRLAPPLVVTDRDIDAAVAVLERVLARS